MLDKGPLSGPKRGPPSCNNSVSGLDMQTYLNSTGEERVQKGYLSVLIERGDEQMSRFLHFSHSTYKKYMTFVKKIK